MIGFFDSGFGGLTILRSVVELLPEYGNELELPLFFKPDFTWPGGASSFCWEFWFIFFKKAR